MLYTFTWNLLSPCDIVFVNITLHHSVKTAAKTYRCQMSCRHQQATLTVADPGFPAGGVDLVGDVDSPRRLRFENFVCRNERIWTLGVGEGRAPGTSPRSANAQECLACNGPKTKDYICVFSALYQALNVTG